MRITAAFFLALAAALAAPARAASDDPPSRVGRVSWTAGEVALYADPERSWEKAYVNSPLTSENSLWTEPRARAEVRIGPTTLRLDELTQLDIRRLDEEQLRAHVVRGRVIIRVRDFDRGDRYLLSTPQARFSLLAAGTYRLEAEESGQSVLTVFSGAAQVEAGRRAEVRPGDAVRVREDGEHFDFERAAATPFDDWSATRDQRIDRAARETERFVSPHMTGYEDLGEYGSWSTERDYGPIWYPTRVAVDYVPYRDGRWVYTRPWGWTWVDNAPWGYAPFHYGRWVYVGNRWGWCPGRYVARPVWAPALVGWVGGSGFNISISTGIAPALGWYPLSPWDHYRPWYTNDTRYINNVNVIVNNPPRHRERDRDRNRERGATVVLREDFVQSRPVAAGVARVPGEAWRDAVRGQPAVANPTQVLPPRPAAPRTIPPAQVGGQTAGAAPLAPPPARPGTVSGAPAISGTVVPGAPAAPRTPPPPQVSGQSQSAPPPQAQPATRSRPAPEQREERRPASQLPALQSAPAPRPVPPPQAVPQPAPQPAQQGGETARPAKPAKETPQPKPAKEEQAKPEKEDKPARGRER